MSSLHVYELWRDVTLPEWSPFYAVSSLGRVKNKRNTKILGPFTPGANGYLSVTLKAAGKKSFCITIHRLVLLAFKGQPPSPRHECLHGDGDRINNVEKNLSWGTRKENFVDKILHGNSKRKFNKKQVQHIKLRINRGDSSYSIAKDFDVSPQTIINIKTGISYFI